MVGQHPLLVELVKKNRRVNSKTDALKEEMARGEKKGRVKTGDGALKEGKTR